MDAPNSKKLCRPCIQNLCRGCVEIGKWVPSYLPDPGSNPISYEQTLQVVSDVKNNNHQIWCVLLETYHEVYNKDLKVPDYLTVS